METLLVVIALASVILSVYLFLKRKSRKDEIETADPEDDEEYEDIAPFEEQRAIILDMRMNLRNFGRYERSNDKYHRLKYFIDFQLNNGEIKTLEVSERQYEMMSVGEFAALVTQNDRFIDFGGKFAEPSGINAAADNEDEQILYDEYEGDKSLLVAGEDPDELEISDENK